MVSECINLCDIGLRLAGRQGASFEKVMDECVGRLKVSSLSRIYIGSYFCSNHFIRSIDRMLDDVRVYCDKTGIPMTLVVPITIDAFLDDVKKHIDHALSECGCIDEICVNDYGMMDYIRGNYGPERIRLGLGRLMMKDMRDARIEQLKSSRNKPMFLTRDLISEIKRCSISFIDIENIYETLDLSDVPEDVTACVHGPYIYMSTGQVCLYESINKDVSSKFRATNTCGCECMSSKVLYSSGGSNWLRLGKAVFMPSIRSKIIGSDNLRKVVWPVDLWEM